MQGQGQGYVKLKVSKMTIFKIYFFRHFSTNQKIPKVSDTRPKYLKSLGPDFVISSKLLSHVTSKFAKNRLCPILMKLGMMLEVDETFTTI